MMSSPLAENIFTQISQISRNYLSSMAFYSRESRESRKGCIALLAACRPGRMFARYNSRV